MEKEVEKPGEEVERGECSDGDGGDVGKERGGGEGKG